MQLIVISPEHEDPRERAVLVELLWKGLVHFHLRKPQWERSRLRAWLESIPSEHHPRIILHTHHDLAQEFRVGGVHDRDGMGTANDQRCEVQPGLGMIRSCAVHDLAMLRSALLAKDRVLFSPVFPSLSKPGYMPTHPFEDIEQVLSLPRTAEAIALGGVTVDRIRECRELGFDGIAVLGAVWLADDPVDAFAMLQKECNDVRTA